MIDGNIGRALGVHPAVVKQDLHLGIVGRFPDEGVFAFDIEQDRRKSGLLRLSDHPRDRCRFPTPSRPDDPGVSREHTLNLRRNADRNRLMSNSESDPQIAPDTQDRCRFVIVQDEHRAVRQWSKSGRLQHAANPFAEEVDTDAAVVLRHEDPAADSGRHDQWRIGPQSIRLGERAFDDDPEVGPSILDALDS
jgi:hypothetical protein